MANWTPEGFIGKMFEVFKRHLPPSNSLPSVMLWGHEPAVFERLKMFNRVMTERRLAAMRYPFSPEETVDFFRRFYGPTVKAFESLDVESQMRLRMELIELQTVHNTASLPGATEALAEYLEIIAFRNWVPSKD